MLPKIIEIEGRYFHQMKGASGYYISKSGAIYSTYKRIVRQVPLQTTGYLQSTFKQDDGRTKRLQVHRLVALQFIPNPEGKPTVNHGDGNKSNCNVWNLEWMTRKENDHHARTTGLTPNGMKRSNPAALFPRYCNPRPCYYAAPALYRFTLQPATL